MTSIRMAAAALAAALSLLGASASAVTIDFSTNNPRLTNDGVFTISAAQADKLGISGATRVGAVGIRTPSRSGYDVGDMFNVSALLEGVIGGQSNIIGWLNGTNSNVSYTGAAFAPLGDTTITGFDRASDRKLFSVVYFGFANGDVTVRGTNTFGFNAASADFSTIVPIPLPAAGWLMLAGLGGLGVAARRRRKAA